MLMVPYCFSPKAQFEANQWYMEFPMCGGPIMEIDEFSRTYSNEEIQRLQWAPPVRRSFLSYGCI